MTLRRVPPSLSGGTLLLGLIAIGTLLPLRTASGQTRGSLQVTASVVPTQASFGAISLAHQALREWVRDGRKVTTDASTVAQVRIAYEPARQADAARMPTGSGDLVVHVDFLKN